MTGQRRTRREPPPFRIVEVAGVEPLTPFMSRVTLRGQDLAGFRIDEPAASVRLLLPVNDQLVLPTWNGNEFLLDDGSRPTIRTFTPRKFNSATLELDLDIVLHARGATSMWVKSGPVGAPAGISGPGRGYTIDPDATSFLLAGDETAIPAICQLLEVLPDVPIDVHVEIRDSEARLDLHRDASVSWHELPADAPPGDTLPAAVRGVGLGPDSRVWAAGEAAAMHRVRKILFEELSIPRSHAAVRGYWKRR